MSVRGYQGIRREGSRQQRCWSFVALVTLSFASLSAGAAGSSVVGNSVAEALRAAESAGIRIIFTDRLVPPELRVDEAPDSQVTVEALREILRPHALELDELAAGIYVVKRAPQAHSKGPAGPLQELSASPQQVQVAASRYEIDMSTLRDAFALDGNDLEMQPALSNDATRAIRRFPGTAGTDISARTFVRGGSPNENLILLDGVPLHDAFHLKALPISYSIIDPSTIGRAEFFSGVLPVEQDGYMSSMLSMQIREPAEDFGGRMALNMLDASAFFSGRLPGERNDWLLFGRRGLRGSELDPVKPSIGKPRVTDTLARVRFHGDDDSMWTLGGMVAQDRTFYSQRDVGDFTADESAHRYAWTSYEKSAKSFTSRTLLTYTSLESKRDGSFLSSLAGPIGLVRDGRAADVFLLRQDGTTALLGANLLRWGLSAKYERAFLSYFRQVQLAEDIAALFNRAVSDSSSTFTKVSLRERQAYLGITRPLGSRVTLDGGVHWLHGAYSTDQTDSTWDPRLNVLFAASATTRLRLSWGRMSQAFAAIDLPLERNRLVFDERPSSTMRVLSLEQDFARGLSMRAELFDKHVERPQPRLENVFMPVAFLPELRADAYIVAPQSSATRGFDFYVAARFSDRMSGWLTYSRSRATDEIDGLTIARGWDQRHSFATGLTFEDRGWSLSAMLSAHSNWPLTPLYEFRRSEVPEGEIAIFPLARDLVIGSKNSRREGYFIALDLKAERSIQLRPGSLRFSVELTNATDRRNKCCDETLFGTFNETLGSSEFQEPMFWQHLRPYAGISWEF